MIKSHWLWQWWKSNLVLGCWNHLVRDSVDSPVSLEMVASLGGITAVINDVMIAVIIDAMIAASSSLMLETWWWSWVVKSFFYCHLCICHQTTLLSSYPWAYITIYIKLHLILRRLLTLGLWEVGGCPSGGRLGSCCWEKTLIWLSNIIYDQRQRQEWWSSLWNEKDIYMRQASRKLVSSIQRLIRKHHESSGIISTGTGIGTGTGTRSYCTGVGIDTGTGLHY